ncbi:MAG: glutamate racemase [Leptonema sp. (in: bacteria)]
MDLRPIGVFDSGLGGLTVLAELFRILPNEEYIYIGDTARVPYGSRSKETIERYSLEIASYLVRQDIKLLVVACNTASSYALEVLKKHFSIPIVGVIEPAIYGFFKNSRNSKVAVIGTRGTIKSKSYSKIIHRIDSEVQVFSKACPLFVPLVEEDFLEHPITYAVIKEYLQEIVDNKIQDIILGCTHYPLLKKAILSIYPDLNLIDSSLETALYVKNLLKDYNIENQKQKNQKRITKIFLTDITERASILKKLFLEKDGYFIIEDDYLYLKNSSEIKFILLVQELKLEDLIIEKAF